LQIQKLYRQSYAKGIAIERIMSTRNGKCTEDMELRAYYFAFQPIFQILLGSTGNGVVTWL